MEPSNFERRASTLVRLQNTQDYSQFKSESAGLSETRPSAILITVASVGSCTALSRPSLITVVGGASNETLRSSFGEGHY